MPIFEYVCRACDFQFEELVLSRADAIACPQCRGTRCDQQLSVFSAGSNGAGSSADTATPAMTGGACCGGGCGCR